ncbi:MAG: DUF499 domain-containing protein [Anaerolineaceae bacterium]|nr:DUF499 domain-containing protein [Anaerolineaceae bacterium]
MPASLKQLCTPRPSVFDSQRRDTVLDITDLINDKIDPAEFLEENYITEGMKTLLEQGFRRLEGKSNQGVFNLKQAMGGGKTHNLLTLGLLARHPEFRQKVMGKTYQANPSLGPVKVVAFSGRESDAPLGIWGAIADQLGKKEHFKDLYSPLQAPGQTAWETLLDGQTVLILLDELPPYFENASSKAIGNSDLARVTATALTNLLVALGKESCSHVCLVITDLAGAYKSGSGRISEILSDFEKETHKLAMNLEPVRMNSDELYQILRKRIFDKLPSEHEITDVAQAYAKAIRDAKQMDITNESPEQFATHIQNSYPFHPAIRDLYARFRENPGFQQTRGLIRIMRIATSRLWNSDEADKRYLISAQDLDFNDRETRSEIGQINSTLDNAIAHDIASDGTAVAEVMDQSLGGRDTRDACRLILMSSLANVPNAVIGLPIPTLMAYLAEPGRDIARLKTEVLEKLATAAWYMHSDRDGKLYFKNVQNLNAKLESLVKAYLPEQAVKELRTRLEDLFKPVTGWCYQRVLALPAIDEIELEQDKVTLVIAEPYAGGGLRQELRDFFEQATWKNRLAYLSGPKPTYDTLIDTGKRLKAIQHIIDELVKDRTLESDPQMVQAKDLSDRIRGNFYSAVRETFTTLYYPLEENGKASLVNADFSMKFEGNKYNGEQQILELLKDKMKFTEDVASETFRKKCEQRLFTIQSMPWNEIKKRAAMLPKWQWHLPSALEDLKTACIQKDVWREEGGYVDKGPFPQPKTSAKVQEVNRSLETGEATLKVMAVNGDTIYYDYGAPASTASAKLAGSELKTAELNASFLVVDSTHVHETGEPVSWKNRITIQYRFFQSGTKRMLELRAAPPAPLCYTTNGSDPKLAGASYDEPFCVPAGSIMVLAYAERDGVTAEVLRIPVPIGGGGGGGDDPKVDPKRAAVWVRGFDLQSTKETYETIERAKKHSASFTGVKVTIMGEGGDKEWIELQTYQEKQVSPELVEEVLATLRKLQGSGQVQLGAAALNFSLGQDLLDWVEEVKTTLKAGEVKQS